MDREDVYFAFRIPHDAEFVSTCCNLLFGERIETTTNRTGVIVHPRPRQLTEPELAQLEAVLRNAKPFALSVDKATIRADGEDYATVTVESAGETVVLSVRGQDVEVALQDGVGTLEIAATAPTVEPIVVQAKDQLVYGFAQIEVKAI